MPNPFFLSWALPPPASDLSAQMLYSQIVLTRGLPLNLHLPAEKPVSLGALSREELDREFQKGIDSLKTRRGYTIDEVDAELNREFGI